MLRRIFLFGALSACTFAAAQQSDTTTVDIGSVMVEGRGGAMHIEDGRMVFDAASIARRGAATTVWEALKQLPGISEERDGLTLNGAGGLPIVLNGKPSTMTAEQLRSMLEAMPAERAERLELSYNAPPRWGVRGAALNIVLNRRGADRWSGELHGGYERQGGDRPSVGGSVIHTGRNWYADAAYDFRRGSNRMYNKLLSLHRTGEVLHSITQAQDGRSHGTSHQIRTTVERAAEGRSTLSAVYTARFDPLGRSRIHATGTYADSERSEHEQTSLHNLSLRYRSAEGGWNLSADYTRYRTNGENTMQNNYAAGTADRFVSLAAQRINRLGIDLDRTRRAGKRWSLDWGGSFEFADVANSQIYTATEGDRRYTDTRSRMREYTVSAYAGASYRFPHGSISAAVTGEYFRMDGRNRTALYPQLTLQWTPHTNHLLQLTISTDKSYPAYWQTRQFVSYLDGYAEIHGSPSLPPARSCSANLLYLYKQRYLFLLFHNDDRDAAPQTAWQADDRPALVYQCVRADRIQTSGLQLTLPFDAGGRLKFRASPVLIRQSVLYTDFHGLRVDRTRYLARVQADANLRIAPWCDLVLDGFYQSRAIQGTYDIRPCGGLDLRLTLTFDRRRATLTAGCDDLLATAHPRSRVRHHGQHLDMDNSAFNRCVYLRLNYRFTGYKERRHKEVDTSRFGQ